MGDRNYLLVKYSPVLKHRKKEKTPVFLKIHFSVEKKHINTHWISRRRKISLQTVVLPLAVPPATPMTNGANGAPCSLYHFGLKIKNNETILIKQSNWKW